MIDLSNRLVVNMDKVIIMEDRYVQMYLQKILSIRFNR